VKKSLHLPKIIGTGSYLPEKILSNKDLEKMVETSDEWIVTRTGIKERHIAKEDEYTSDMAYQASLRALEDAKLDPKEIDLILVATLTPDYIFPSTACLVQQKLGATKAAALDIQAACTGYIYALSIAKAYIEAGIYQNILIVASEKLSSIVDYTDRSTCVLFGDGAAACVVSSNSDKPGLIVDAVTLGADGVQSELLILPGGGSRHPATEQTVKEKMHYLKMSGNEVFKHAVRRMENASKECLEIAEMQETDIHHLIPHQANLRIIDAIARRFSHIPSERVYKKVVERYGNTSASSVGIALDDLMKEKKINHGENVLMTAFGAGLTWGATILTSDR